MFTLAEANALVPDVALRVHVMARLRALGAEIQEHPLPNHADGFRSGEAFQLNDEMTTAIEEGAKGGREKGK